MRELDQAERTKARRDQGNSRGTEGEKRKYWRANRGRLNDEESAKPGEVSDYVKRTGTEKKFELGGDGLKAGRHKYTELSPNLEEKTAEYNAPTT